MAELGGGAVLGLAITEFWGAVKDANNRAKGFKPQLKELQWTLQALVPTIEDIEAVSTELKEFNSGEVQRLISIMEDGRELISKCIGVSRWNIIKKIYYQKKLVELDNKIIRFNIKNILPILFREVKYARLEQSRGFDRISNQICSLQDRSGLRRIRLMRFEDSIEFPTRSVASERTTLLRIFRQMLGRFALYRPNCLRFRSASFGANSFSGPDIDSSESIYSERIYSASERTPLLIGIFRSTIFIVVIIRRFTRFIIDRSKTTIISVLEKSESGIWMVIKDVGMLKTTIKQLEDTMRSVISEQGEIESRSDGGEVAERLASLLEEGEKLVSESSKIGRWNFVKKWQYQKKMVVLENRLLKIKSLSLQARLAKKKDKTSGADSEMKEDELLLEKAKHFKIRTRNRGRFVDTRNSMLINNVNPYQLLIDDPPII